MGLLDTGGFDDPGTIGLLSFGARMSNAPGGFMRNLGGSVLGALSDRGDARKDIARQQQEQLRMQLLQQQMEDAQAQRQAQMQARANQEKLRAFLLQNPNVEAANRMALETGMTDPMDALKSMQPKAPKLMSVAPGNVVIDEATGQPRFTAPNKPEGLPEGMRMGLTGPEWIPGYLEGRGQVARQGASNVSYGAPVPYMLPDGSVGYAQPGNKPGAAPQMMTGADGKPLIKPTEEKSLTEGQAKALAFASRMLSADKTLATLNRKGVNVSIPGANAGFGIGDAVNVMQSEEHQMLDQAKRDFLNAALRRESGALIGADEFRNGDKQYFPQIGDSRAVIEQKARNRRSAIEGVRADVPKSKQAEVDRISGSTPGGWSITPVQK